VKYLLLRRVFLLLDMHTENKWDETGSFDQAWEKLKPDKNVSKIGTVTKALV